jgi:hypothetical protein
VRENQGRNIQQLLLTVFCLSALSLPCMAQKSTLEDLLKGPHWGQVEDALVGVEVITDEPTGKTVRHGLGMVLRCDGFILIPTDLFAVNGVFTTHKGTITVVLHPGTDEEVRYAGHAPRNVADRISYAALKLDGFHSVALKTLLPDTLNTGDEVEIVWRPWVAATNHYGALVRRKVKLGSRTAPTSAISAVAGGIDFEEPIEGVPGGAVVIGPEGMAIGLVPGGVAPGRRTNFIAFDILWRVTNSVGVTPTPDSLFTGEVETFKPQEVKAKPVEGEPGAPPLPGNNQRGGKPTVMVRVPGGPVTVVSNLLKTQPDMESEPVACVPDFEMDKYEVTNGQYLAYLRTLPEKLIKTSKFLEDYWPIGWEGWEQPFPEGISDLPVIGVPFYGASAYARSVGKRLPTLYEWLRAAFGPDGDPMKLPWMKEYLTDRQQQYLMVRDAHAQYLMEHPEVASFRPDLDVKNRKLGEPLGRLLVQSIPWSFSDTSLTHLTAFSYDVCMVAFSNLNGKWGAIYHVLPGGSRTFDVSQFGVADMMFNACEWFQPYPATTGGGPPQFLWKIWIPIASTVYRPAAMAWPEVFHLMPSWPTWARLIRQQIWPGAPASNTGAVPSVAREVIDKDGNPALQFPGDRRPLFEHSVLTPEGALYEQIRAGINVAETVNVITPLAGCELLLSDLRYTTTSMGITADAIAGSRFWRAIPGGDRRETGIRRPVVVEPPRAPVDLINRFNSRDIRNYPTVFVAPVGFRCVR